MADRGEAVARAFPTAVSPISTRIMALSRGLGRSPPWRRSIHDSAFEYLLCSGITRLFHCRSVESGAYRSHLCILGPTPFHQTLRLFPSAVLSFSITISFPILHPLHLNILLLPITLPFLRLCTPPPLPNNHPICLAILLEA